MFLHQRRWWYHHPTHPHHQTQPEIWCQWPMVGKQINGEHNKHSKPIGDFRQKRTTTLGRSVGGSWIDIKCYQNMWPCDHLWSKTGPMYHVFGTPAPKMVLNTVLYLPNPVETDATKTTLCTGVFTGLKRQFKRQKSMVWVAVGNGACIVIMINDFTAHEQLYKGE